MVYINPIEILKLTDKDVQEIDSSLVKKAKRRLFADIDLSDNGHYEYHGQSLTKSDCERAIEELEDKEKVEFYSHLASNFELNTFLANGSSDLLNNLKQESIYKLPTFVNFISPFFASKIDLVLLKSFKNKDFELFSSALRAEHLISKDNLNRAFKSLSNEIRHRIGETDKLIKEIKEEISDYTDDGIEDVIDLVENRFPTEYLNKLPIFFQSQINKISASINFLQLSIWNEFNSTYVPVKLLEHLLKLNIESVSKPTFEKNYLIVKKKHEERIEQEKNAPLLKEWARILISIQEKVEKVDNDTLKAKSALSFVQSSFKLDDLNELPSFATEIRTQIAYSIRSLSISSWNKQQDIDSAIELISISQSIDLEAKDRERIEKDYQDLLVIKLKRESQGTPIKSAPSLSTVNGIGTTIYGQTHYFVFFAIPIIPLARYSCEQTYNGYRFYGKLKLHTWQKVWQYGVIAAVTFFILNLIIENN